MSPTARLRVCLVFACAVVLCLASGSPVSAGTAQDAEERREEELARKAEEYRANGRLAARAFCVAIGGVIVWVAFGIARNGLGIGSGLRRTTGPVAWVAAIVVAAVGLSVAIGGQMYAPDLLVRP
ncbi:unnamed protein product [Gemmata massiliana]|uniref:Uncharacterized protein n=1 Tax=Gemmata massiliana TaxID=1210884 RepID=A0A6P2DK26_9BACT|nr:hypothetical protein [Gemmata massiliana]VTS02909.1 unnamed protein product [Gemmata massiliana]